MSAVLAAGLDVGSSSVKVAIVRSGGGSEQVVATAQDRIRRRDPREVIDMAYRQALSTANLAPSEVHYVASTGEGELVSFRRGHFYSMTTHARGGLFLCPEASAVLDVGALHGRAISVDARARVLSYRMTSQCASGSGQFLENIARYLGVGLDEVGALSQAVRHGEKISSICAVLAETDVINMVSRGIGRGEILRGIHESMAGRFVKLLRASKAQGTVLVTGGLSADTGLVAAMQESAAQGGARLQLVTHPWGIYAGAIGAGLWGAFRHMKLRLPAAVEESRVSAQ